ncbi:DUF6415 family natural product biosynthesis protein [Streptomyces carpinensis]|uniref:DUF6415 family natural product biosynthesis protein n=1 Tax=Streptomyces carpinensis TaxID=66369 RepID=A0ABV1VYB6_9ACTN|nr:DUF6415 family natural product biosynthesis protein [Streptomyces carpinensis]
MTQRTAHPPTGVDRLPLDLETMRATARRLLGGEAQLPTGEGLDTHVLALRGHLELLVPVVEAATLRLPKDHVPRACALACVGEARMRLRLGDGATESVRLAVAVKLARSVNALADHTENLNRARR